MKNKKQLNQAHRQTPNGWLIHYYGRLKRAKKIVTQHITAKQFSAAARRSYIFTAAWERYAASGFEKKYTPKYLNFVMLDGGEHVAISFEVTGPAA